MRLYLRYFIALLLLPAALQIAEAQERLSTRSSRAIRLYQEGKRAYEFYDFRAAERRLKEAISTDEEFFEAHLLLAEMLYDTRRFQEAAVSYARAMEIDSLKFPNGYFFLAESQFRSGNYKPALGSYKIFLDSKAGSGQLRRDAKQGIKSSEFSIAAVNNPVPFTPTEIDLSAGQGVNDYSPTVTADGRMLMFTRETVTGRDPLFGQRTREDFYISYRGDDGSWSSAVSAGTPLNTAGNEGAQTIGPGGHYMYFTACNRPDGMGRCDIYYSSFDGNEWSTPRNIGPPVNTEYWESMPSISADGNTLYFVSNRPGGYGGMDIWISHREEDGRWGEPVNAGDVINTAGDETSPFIHFDGKSLYFSSNGRPNLGGYDIYLSRMQEDDSWSEPLNLGYPINTHRDEVGLTIESNGIRAYYSSTATSGGEKRLFYFDLHESARPGQVSFLRGRVYDRESGLAVEARYELTDLSTGEEVARALTTRNGEFLVCMPTGKNYGLNVIASGFLFYSQNFPFDGEYTDYQPLVKDIPLKRIEKGEKLVLNNILFDTDSAVLKPESEAELSNLLLLLEENSSITVEISGHTDDTGGEEYNQKLSEERALAVVKYLTERGIDKARITHRGYGMTKPVADNRSEEGRRLNRRTEVVITGKEYPPTSAGPGDR